MKNTENGDDLRMRKKYQSVLQPEYDEGVIKSNMDLLRIDFKELE